MDESRTKALMIGGSAVTGGAFGAWAGAKPGAADGLRAGPWGVIAGTAVGTIAGAMLLTTRNSDNEKA